MDDLQNNKSPIHIIGIVDTGSNAVEFIQKRGVKAKFTIITETNRKNLASEINYIEFSPKGKRITIKNEEFRFPDFSESVAIPKNVDDLFKNEELYVLLAGFGGHTGTLLTQELAFKLKKEHKPFYVVCSLPFTFEGQTRNKFANATKEKLQNFPNFSCLSLDIIREKQGNIQVQEAFEKANEEFYEIIKNLFELNSSVAKT